VTPGPDATFETGSLSAKAGLAAEKAGEVVSGAAAAATETATGAAGAAARTVADVADQVAERFER
jgi:hypothetical protein